MNNGGGGGDGDFSSSGGVEDVFLAGFESWSELGGGQVRLLWCYFFTLRTNKCVAAVQS